VPWYVKYPLSAYLDFSGLSRYGICHIRSINMTKGEKMTLIFQNSMGRERIIAECETLTEVNKAIYQFLEDHHFKSYYTRVMPDGSNPNRVMLDVGSHVEFFFIEGITFDEYIAAERSQAAAAASDK
jgi:hypothetical protein